MRFKNKLVLGVTGKFGAGKTTICRMLQKLGFVFIDADKIVHEIYKPKKIGYFKIKKYFGSSFIDFKKGVLRWKLRKLILENNTKLKLLNKIIHPLIFRILNKKIVQSKGKLICIESIHFEKNGLLKLIDRVLLVKRNSKLIKCTMQKSKWSSLEIVKFMKITSLSVKANFIIENNSGFKDLKEKVNKIFDLISNLI